MNEWIVIEASHSRELQGIRFQDGFKIRVLLNTELSSPEYPVDKKVEASQYEIPKATKQISKKRYSFIIPATERLADTFSVIRMCDNVVMSRNNGNINSIYDINFSLEQKHDEGAFPVINCNFIVEPIIDKGCEDETDLLPESGVSHYSYLDEEGAFYLDPSSYPSAAIGMPFIIAKHTEFANERGYKVEVLLQGLTWENILITDPEFNATNKIIYNLNNPTVKWIYNGSYWHPLCNMMLTNPSGTLIKAIGDAVVDTLVKVEYRKSTDPFVEADTVSQGTFVSDGVAFDVGSTGYWHVKCTCLTNSGTYYTLTKFITLS